MLPCRTSASRSTKIAPLVVSSTTPTPRRAVAWMWHCSVPTCVACAGTTPRSCASHAAATASMSAAMMTPNRDASRRCHGRDHNGMSVGTTVTSGVNDGAPATTLAMNVCNATPARRAATTDPSGLTIALPTCNASNRSRSVGSIRACSRPFTQMAAATGAVHSAPSRSVTSAV